MTSEAQIAANRRSARKSTGPRSRAGKQRASRNAYRHGLSLAVDANPSIAQQIDKQAHAIMGDYKDAIGLEYARVIAEAEFTLARVRQTKLALIERIRCLGAFDPAPEFFLGPQECIRLTRAMWAGQPMVPHLKREFIDAIVLRALPPATQGEPQGTAEAIRRALPILNKLNRYEQRASSRRNRAVRKLIQRKSSFGQAGAGGW